MPACVGVGMVQLCYNYQMIKTVVLKYRNKIVKAMCGRPVNEIVGSLQIYIRNEE